MQRKSSLRNSFSKNQLYAEEFIIAESPTKVKSFLILSAILLNYSLLIDELKLKSIDWTIAKLE